MFKSDGIREKVRGECGGYSCKRYLIGVVFAHTQTHLYGLYELLMGTQYTRHSAVYSSTNSAIWLGANYCTSTLTLLVKFAVNHGK